MNEGLTAGNESWFKNYRSYQILINEFNQFMRNILGCATCFRVICGVLAIYSIITLDFPIIVQLGLCNIEIGCMLYGFFLLKGAQSHVASSKAIALLKKHKSSEHVQKRAVSLPIISMMVWNFKNDKQFAVLVEIIKMEKAIDLILANK